MISKVSDSQMLPTPTTKITVSRLHNLQRCRLTRSPSPLPDPHDENHSKSLAQSPAMCAQHRRATGRVRAPAGNRSRRSRAQHRRATAHARAAAAGGGEGVVGGGVAFEASTAALTTPPPRPAHQVPGLRHKLTGVPDVKKHRKVKKRRGKVKIL